MANQYFNAAYYLAQNPDVAAAGYTLATAEQHYLKFGAAEGRNPNTYFNATQYLAQYPDLVVAGITKATALAHYAQFGLNEGRIPSLAANPADFSYTAYATANADLRTAFGITDVNNLTAAQQHSLLAHYLSYGYVEGRTGVVAVNGDAFFTTLGSNQFSITAAGTFQGTSGNDNFTVADAITFGATTQVNGLGGTDTLTIGSIGADTTVNLNSVENIVVSAVALGSVLTVTGVGGQTSLAVTEGANTFGYTGAALQSVSLNGAGAGAVTANFNSGVTGTADALKLSIASGHTGAFSANGIENYTVDFNTTATVANSVALHANAVNGAALTTTLTGGVKGLASTIVIDSAGSADLATYTVNGSAFLGNANVSVTAAANTNVTITTGAGVDTLNASLGIDTLTGGAGNDVFAFVAANAIARTTGTGAATVISAQDTIADFQAGDTLTLAGGPLVTGGAAVAGVGAVTGGVLTFNTSYLAGKSLTNVVNDIDAGGLLAGSNVVFKFGADTYLVHTGADLTTTDVIKLTGVDATKLIADATGVHFA